jgi:hypothetical protein
MVLKGIRQLKLNSVCLGAVFVAGAAAMLPTWSPEAVATEIAESPTGCPAEASVGDAGPGSLLSCRYSRTSRLLPSHVGGPWLNIDLLHVKEAELRALRDREADITIYPRGMGGDPPIIPRLGLVHAQICLSDPHVSYNKCPNDYPRNASNIKYGYELNPHIIPLLQRGLDRVRRAGLKVILRFTYNYPNCSTEGGKTQCDPKHPQDAPIHVILDHMRKLAPTVQANSDVIFALQAGFIGRWGEWHNSTHGNDSPRRHDRFLDAYRDLFSGVTNLEVRRPEYILDYAKHIGADQQPDGYLGLGLGLHDDQFGSDKTDAGTFEPVSSNYSPCDLRIAAAQLAAKYTMTGETSDLYYFHDDEGCGDLLPKPTSYGDFADLYSLTTLQLVFQSTVWHHWWVDGTYDYKVRHIGPHLALETASLSMDPNTRRATLELSVSNTGWATVANKRPLFLVLRRGEQTVLKQRIGFDLTHVLAGSTREKKVDLGSWANLAPGRYDAYLLASDPAPRLADRADYALLFENEGTRLVPEGLNILGSFELAR